jgi:hypothetical protein
LSNGKFLQKIATMALVWRSHGDALVIPTAYPDGFLT